MDPYLLAIIVLGGVLLVVTMYMEWIGVISLLTPRSGSRYVKCGHVRMRPYSSHDCCWTCRHRRLHRALELAEHPFQHSAG